MTLKQMLLAYKALQDLNHKDFNFNFIYKTEKGDCVNCLTVVKGELEKTIKCAVKIPFIVDDYIVTHNIITNDLQFHPKIEVE